MAGEMPNRSKDLPVSKLSEGPPAQYQLVTKKESLDGKDEAAASKLKRWTLGEKDSTKPSKTILLVGETGTGKSTLINAMVNYVMGVEWEDKIWFEIVEQELLPADKLTSDINVYEIFGFEDRRVPYSLTIIDTSGHADTENPGAMDKQHNIAQQLHDLVITDKAIQEIDAVGIVFTESTKILSEQLKYIFNSVVSLFGKDMEKNIVSLIIDSNGMSAANALQALEDAEIKCAKDEHNEPVHFMFQNVQHTVISAKNLKQSQRCWGMTEERLEGFFGFLEMTDPRKPCIGNLKDRMFLFQSEGEIPHRFKDLPVSKLSEGPPARYQLVTKTESLDGEDEEAASKLKRWTLGEKDPTKPNKTILLIGETGTGKSTLINAMVNYVMGVEWEDKVWFEIVEQSKQLPAKRHTSDVNVYEIFGFEDRRVPYSLTIIDTSGHADTENPGAKDKQHSIAQQLHDLFISEKEIQEIHTVGIVMTESTKILSDQLKYIFHSVVSLFGKDMKKNIIALITESNGISAANALQALEEAQIKCVKNENNEPIHFMFQNVQHTVITAKTQSKLLFYWGLTKEGMEGFFGFLVKADPKKPYIGIAQNRTRSFHIAGEIPLRFTDIPVSKLSEGPPTRYQLLPKKESLDGKDEADSRLRRWTLGEKDPTKPNKTILLIGETGAGKPTLINAMVNYVMGVEWEEMIWFEIIEDGKNKQTSSQTADVTVYEIFGFEEGKVPYSVTIIDTPGYGATDGNDHDVLISQTLYDLFRCDKGIKEIDTVGLVFKASENQLSDRLKSILDSVVSLFGKDLESNIVALLTNSNGKSVPNALQALEDAEVKCATTKNDETVYFLFDNFQKDSITAKQYLNLSQGSWKITKKGMDAFFRFLRKASSRKLNTPVEVLAERIRLKACIGNLHDRIELIEMKQTEIRQTQDALEKQKTIMQTQQKSIDQTLEKWKSLRENKESEQKNHESIAEAIEKHKEIIEKQKKEMEANQNFIVEVDEPYKERVLLGGLRDNKAICCTVCEETCHYPGCTLAIGPCWCEVMKLGRCTSCTGKCSHRMHVKERWRYVNSTRKVKKTLEDLKEKYEKNKKMIQDAQNQLENTFQQIKEHDISKQEMTKEEQELSTQITQVETDCEAYKDGIRESESILGSMSEEMEGLEADKARWVEETYQHVVKLQEISLNTLSMSTYIYLDFLIDKMTETGDMEKVQRLEDIKKRCEEKRKDGIRYMAHRFGSLVEKCKALPSLPAHLKSKAKHRNQK